MLLDPSGKIEHIRRYWGIDKLNKILVDAKVVYKEHYTEMYTGRGNPAPVPHQVGSLTACKIGILLWELSDNEDSEDPETHAQDASADLNDAWLEDFNGYLHSRDQLGTITYSEPEVGVASKDHAEGDADGGGWDTLVEDLEEDKDYQDFKDEDVFVQSIE
ncbi:hypothetical protein EDB86DRAFT_2837970 [Lactarius hatsudake]|nr:hypothetical protein EDB86DRAFT_2837970 [Lactarius hatsudake]